MSTKSSAAKFVAYLRVSTDKQGRSGLGLAAQRAAVNGHCASVQGSILAEYVEVESGANAQREQLAAAITKAKRAGATLLVAKLCRLSRSVAEVATIIASGASLCVAESPNATTLELHLRVMVAQEERDRISSNTKAALRAAKAQGALLGSSRLGHWDGRESLRLAGNAKGSRSAAAGAARRREEAAAEAMPVAVALRGQGRSLAFVAANLNDQCIRSSRGGKWTPNGVARLLESQ